MNDLSIDKIESEHTKELEACLFAICSDLANNNAKAFIEAASNKFKDNKAILEKLEEFNKIYMSQAEQFDAKRKQYEQLLKKHDLAKNDLQKSISTLQDIIEKQKL